MVIQKKPDRATILADIEGEKRFFCHDGCIIKNMSELVGCLNHIPEEAFLHHVTPEKNDFSTWIRDVYGEQKLAGDLYSVSSPQEAVNIVTGRLDSLQSDRNQYRRSKKRI
jgi:hypothetical protein